MSAGIVKEAVVLLSLQQGKNNVNLKQQLDPAVKAQQEWIKEIEKAQRALQEQTKAATHFNSTFLEETKASIEISHQLGEGVISLTRGITLLGFEGSDSLKEMVQQLARIQAAFDIWRGSTQIIKTFIESVQRITVVQTAWTAATAAHTTAQGLNTAAVLAGTKAVIANTAAKVANLAVTNPWAAAALALTAAIWATVAALREETETVEDQIEALERQRRAREDDIKVRQAVEQLAGGSRAQATLKAEKDRVAAIDAQVASLRALRQERMRAAQVAESASFAGADIMGDAAEAKNAAAEIQRQETQLLNERIQRLLAIKQAEEAVQAEQERSQEQKKRALEEEQRARQALLQQRERELQATMRQAEMERQKAQAMRDQVRGAQAAVGRLDEIDRARLENIVATQERGGQVNRQDLSFISGLGGGFSAFAQQQFAAQGQDATNLLGRLGFTAGGQNVEENLGNVRETAQKIKEGVQDVFENVSATLETTAGKMEQLLERMRGIDTETAQGAQ